MPGLRTRRDFLRLAAGAAVAASGAGAACRSRPDDSGAGRSAKTASNGAAGDETLRIAQWSHFIPAYDAWFDREYTRRWGEEHDVAVIVDHIPFAQLRSRVEAEVAAGTGHDIFGFIVPPPGLEEVVIDHRELVEEVTGKVGPASPLVERSVLNAKTGRYFAFPDFWVPNPAHYRTDLWDEEPSTWAGVRTTGPKLKAAGHPLALGFSSDYDATMGLLALMFAHGAAIQDQAGAVVINSRATVEAVRLGSQVFAAGPTDELLGWDAASDNRSLAAGKASFILDAISAVRTTEKQDPVLATQVSLAPLPEGTSGRIGPYALLGSYVVLKWSRNQESAKQFLIDLAVGSRESFLRSEFYNLPAFPGAIGDLADLLAADPARPAGKYGLLAAAGEWTTNLGHPGHDNAAVEEVFNQFIVPKMFAAAATGKLSPEDAVARAEVETKAIFAKWKERGKI